MANPKLTAAWFAKARSDLQAAKYLLGGGDRFWSQTAFHCQQCAEKAIKGYLTYHAVRFKKIHKMNELLGLVAAKDQALADQLVACEELTKYAVAHRYPDATEVEPLTLELVNAAIASAEASFDLLAKMAMSP